jgi:TonB family protein
MQQYQQPLWGRMEPALRNCFVGAGIIGLVLIIVVWVVPIPVLKPLSVTQVPERIARLILEKPETRIAKANPGGGGGGGGVTESSRPGPKTQEPEAPPEVATPKPAPMPRTPGAPPARRLELPKVAADRGVEGRARATRDVTQNLASVTGSLDKVLSNISTQIPASKKTSAAAPNHIDIAGLPATSSTMPSRSRRGIQGGRSSEQLSSVSGVSSLGSADLSGSAIKSEGVSIGMITDVAGGGGAGLGGTGNGTGGGAGGGQGGGYGTGNSNGVGTGSGGGVGNGSGGGVGDGTGSGRGSAGGASASGNGYRSNETLLAVVRRYAAGIQFCYDNELRKKSGLRGKLVVSMVVLANGSVSEATIVEDTLNSPAVRDCALAQIRAWQFPAIPSGVTSFKTPFVFTPPSQ